MAEADRTTRQLEIGARRRIDEPGVIHHDTCFRKGWSISLQGVDFAVRPLCPPQGVRFAPRINGSDVSVDVRLDDGTADEALLAEARGITESAPIREEEVCEKCGQPLRGAVEIDLDSDQAFLRRLVAYVAGLLRQQYELTDEQLGELLAFDGDKLPAWVREAIRHAHGLVPRSDEPEPAELPFPLLEELEKELLQSVSEQESKPKRRRWWPFGGK